MSEIKFKFLKTNKLTDLPEKPGIYCWYFAPIAAGKKDIYSIISALVETQGRIKAELDVRYGIKYVSESTLSVQLGGKAIEGFISENMDKYGEFVNSFIRSEAFPIFSRPIYIGISGNLYKRVYEQHFKTLESYWETGSNVSHYLASHPDAAITEVIINTSEKRSFALEARCKKIFTTDLVLYFSELPSNLIGEIGAEELLQDSEDEGAQSSLRSLEKLLQVLADPVCGRR